MLSSHSPETPPLPICPTASSPPPCHHHHYPPSAPAVPVSAGPCLQLRSRGARRCDGFSDLTFRVFHITHTGVGAKKLVTTLYYVHCIEYCTARQLFCYPSSTHTLYKYFVEILCPAQQQRRACAASVAPSFISRRFHAIRVHDTLPVYREE